MQAQNSSSISARQILILLVVLAGLAGCSAPQASEAGKAPAAFRLDTLHLYDPARQRAVPVALYRPAARVKHPQLVVFSHGYGFNEGGANFAYAYLNEFLASQGYCVASIQHELKTDSLMPLEGIPQVVRRPFWERGVENIWFVINTLRKSHPELDFEHLTLIGHSNGGDMSALSPQKHPGVANKIICLDNRRVALPRTPKPRVYSLRSSDLPADEGVLPTTAEQQQYGITIVQLPNTKHVEISDYANAAQRAEITGYVLRFLKE